MDFDFEIDKLRKTANTRIIFALPGSTPTVIAYMVSDTFSINGEASYETAFEQSIARSLAQKVGAEKLLNVGKKVLQVQTKNQALTRLSWTGSSKPTFALELMFVAIRKGEDPRRQVSAFLEGVYPTEVTLGMLGAPWGYSPIKKTGMFAVSIGNWFKATNQVLKSVDFNVSKETIETGMPLYASGNISFEPYQDITVSDIKSYFPGT